jgi:hypothetical protein
MHDEAKIVRIQAIIERTDMEKDAYVKGWEAALKAVEAHGLEFAKISIQATKETL